MYNISTLYIFNGKPDKCHLLQISYSEYKYYTIVIHLLNLIY